MGIIKIDVNSYESSHIFSYIIEDYLLLKEMFDKNIATVLDNIEQSDEELNSKKNSLIGEYVSDDLFDIDIGKLENSNLTDFFIKGALLYYYSQFEFKLYEVCERLPLLNNCQDITYFIENTGCQSQNKLDKISLFLSEKADIKITKINNWLKIKDFNEIRNTIVHYEKIGGDKNDKIKKLKTIKSITSRNKNKIIFQEKLKIITIKKSYLTEITKVTYDFIDQVLNDIWNKHHNFNKFEDFN